MKNTFLFTCAVCVGLCIFDAEAQVSRLDRRFNIKRSQPVRTTGRTTPQSRPARMVNTAPLKPRVQESPFVVITGLYNDESVRLPKWYLEEMGELLGELKEKLSPGDYFGLLQREEARFGECSVRSQKEGELNQQKEKLRAILNEPSDTSLYDWNYFLKPNSIGITFYPNLSYINQPILASDEDYVVTPSPLAPKPNVISFWDSRTGRIYRELFIACSDGIDFGPGVYGIKINQQIVGYLFYGFSGIGDSYEPGMAFPDKLYVHTSRWGNFSPNFCRRYGISKMMFDNLDRWQGTGTIGQASYYTNRDAGLMQLPIMRNQRLLEQTLRGTREGQINQVEAKDEATVIVRDMWQYNLAVSLDSLHCYGVPNLTSPATNATKGQELKKTILQKLTAIGCPPGEDYGAEFSSFSDMDSIKLDDEYELFLCRGLAYEEGFEHMVTLGLINRRTGDVMFFPCKSFDENCTILPQAKMISMKNLNKGFAFMSSNERLLFGTIGRKGNNLLIAYTTGSSFEKRKREFNIVELHPEDYTYEIIATHKSEPSTLPDAFVPEKQLILRTEGDNKYSIEELNSWGTNRKMADMYIDPAQGYSIALSNGLYAGSPGCEKFLQYGDGESVVGMQALAPWRNRPAEVLEALGGNVDDIAALRETTKRWLRKQGFDPDNMPSEPSLKDFPAVDVHMPNLFSSTDTARFTVTAKATANDIAKVIVRVDGVEVPQNWSSGLTIAAGEQEELTVEVPLASGQNWIEITPVDSEGISGDTFRFRTIYRSKAKSDLYIVALGVSDYDNPDLQLQYAAKDATDISKALEQYGSGEKHVLLLTNEQVKDRSALEKVRDFLSNTTVNDRVVFYVAGHGMLDDKYNYYYAPAGFDSERIDETGIAMDELTACLQNAKARKKLLLLDTCHSGMLGEEGEEKLAMSGVQLPHGVRAIQHRGMKVKKAIGALNTKQKKRYIEDLFSRGDVQRGINIIAGAAGAEYALESGAWKNGVFTSTIIQALQDSNADANKDGKLNVEELQHYVTSKVAEQTNGEQKPSSVASENGYGFILCGKDTELPAVTHTDSPSNSPYSDNATFSDEHNYSQHSLLIDLIHRYVAARNNGIAFGMRDLYASQVKYKYSDYRVVSRDAVIRDAMPWFARWIMRNYELLTAGYNENSNTLEIIFRYNLRDAKGKTASGYTKETWVLDEQGKIISWDEKLSKGGELSLSPDYTKIY